jgi:hypothetical protein
MAQWGERNGARIEGLSANLIAVRGSDDDRTTLYFVPRDRGKAVVDGYSSLAGGIEALGEIVLTSPRAAEHLSKGSISFASLEAGLESLRTPLDID